uniref:G_PROTEIN_RECEP_F1_2 domain-containing protein n=1 Tax=Meloidogyne hapla TaxID=6305 RepID=A0A1I8B9I6_MELHA
MTTRETALTVEGIVPFFPSIMAIPPLDGGEYNSSHCICSDLQHEDYSPLYAWFNYIVIIVMLPSLSVFGVLTNFINIFVFTRPCMRNSSNTYLLFLAFSDFFVVLTGLFIFWIDSARSYIPQLVQAPYTTVYTLPFGYMAQSCSIYFTVAAAFDCYVCVCWRKKSPFHCTIKKAKNIIYLIIICSIIYNSLRFPQFNLRKCIHDGSGDMIIEICPTYLFYHINTIYNVYLYMFAMTLFPFFILLLLNLLIIFRKSVDAKHSKQLKKSISSSSSPTIQQNNNLINSPIIYHKNGNLKIYSINKNYFIKCFKCCYNNIIDKNNNENGNINLLNTNNSKLNDIKHSTTTTTSPSILSESFSPVWLPCPCISPLTNQNQFCHCKYRKNKNSKKFHSIKWKTGNSYIEMENENILDKEEENEFICNGIKQEKHSIIRSPLPCLVTTQTESLTNGKCKTVKIIEKEQINLSPPHYNISTNIRTLNKIPEIESSFYRKNNERNKRNEFTKLLSGFDKNGDILPVTAL